MRTVEDRHLEEEFARAVDQRDDSDWADVVTRSGVATRASIRELARNRAVLSAVLAVVVVLVAVSAAVGVRMGSATAASTPGPQHVERAISNGTIAWIFDRQLRGDSLVGAGIPVGSTVGSHWQPVKFARVIQPDPASKVRVVVSLIGRHGRNLCMTVFVGARPSGGCGIGHDLKPFSVLTSYGLDVTPSGGLLIAGLASDDVARLELFLPQGRRERVPLRDNVFVIQTPADASAANLVAYDHQGRVIGTNISQHHTLG